ncbi:hypothetical protein PIB30_064389 [Stylosanthes scabra]|uniref:Uncharacterized protein n=1 Tax=Stylosanthes scabra TaxID=79078 RepID=A0ABU6RLZ9_9FABA|nr:hypothetical protein [Stylosanthes scabra]
MPHPSHRQSPTEPPPNSITINHLRTTTSSSTTSSPFYFYSANPTQKPSHNSRQASAIFETLAAGLNFRSHHVVHALDYQHHRSHHYIFHRSALPALSIFTFTTFKHRGNEPPSLAVHATALFSFHHHRTSIISAEPTTVIFLLCHHLRNHHPHYHCFPLLCSSRRLISALF